ncbi:adenosylcobinamide-phosphate synthase CbiB [Mitsuaria sp. GD03876]|uniref:adenosylcobinamide-phosphate synthase CbiB n=1 Tax=Mitsuaria sp. GD03876 TaxID=2975399 RepID=UPI002448EB92|nr:adenosylcobinamide-phosphate synthase CbiB [Mitsuaria sp. GD03876]MDH0863534.1 adenosylcobinamide-phosphate synthase CbiB [Mitsuaria sp. GD03876]
MTPLSWLPALAIPVALLLDRHCGEPPAAMHPVVGMGRFLALFGDRLCAMSAKAAFLGGALAWTLGVVLVGAVAVAIELAVIHGVEPWLGGWHLAVAALLMGAALKPMLAWRMLRDEVGAVETALARSLDDGRQRLSRLVSRDTRALSATEVRETAIETLAENLNDSVVAPLLWFMVAGLPGAAIYRFANTADAMWGYRGRWEWAGKWAARADDVLSWIPARLTALALLAMRPALLARLPREAARTPSPNGGWPMGAMALRLDRALSKPGVYRLHTTGGEVVAGDIATAQRLAGSALFGLAVLIALGAAALRGGFAGTLGLLGASLGHAVDLALAPALAVGPGASR